MEMPTTRTPARAPTEPGPLWQAVQSRDARFDGVLIYAVLTTGVYCRPSCPSRRPRWENVRFFSDYEAADAAGFRPCKRCRPRRTGRAGESNTRILGLCRLIARQGSSPPTLRQLAEHAELSPGYVQRLFRQSLGVSPRQYADALRLARFKQAAGAGASITRAFHDAGYGSSSRFYERGARELGMSPRSYRAGGQGLRIEWTLRKTPLGQLLVAGTERGLCAVRLGDSAESLAEELRSEFARADLHRGKRWLGPWADALAAYLRAQRDWPLLPLDVRSTAFQARVWDALRRLPSGHTATYGEIAAALGAPAAARAVARACAQNPVGVAVPCHRVVPKAGGSGGYRWGKARKQKLLELEKT
jgi:AraC family transcriptional regulator of adaptative response/methylated-DNA-[protein]-cysteine methyltransferase